jgi:hypothetical protein
MSIFKIEMQYQKYQCTDFMKFSFLPNEWMMIWYLVFSFITDERPAHRPDIILSGLEKTYLQMHEYDTSLFPSNNEYHSFSLLTWNLTAF